MQLIVQKIERLDARLDAIQILQAIHTQQLKEHMRRSDLLEKRIEQVDQELKPVNKKLAMVDGVIKFLGITGLIVTTIQIITRLFS